MMHVISQRQRLEHFQRRHAAFREAVADLVHHLPAQFAEDVADASGVLWLDAIEKDGKMIGEDGAFRAVAAGVMGHGHQISAVLVAAPDCDGMQGPDRGRQIKMAATETGGDLLAARVDAGGLQFGERQETVMVPASAGAAPVAPG